MRSPQGWGFLALVAFPALAQAANVSDEVAAGSQQPTANNPRSGYVSERLGGVVDLSEEWNLRGDATVTYDAPTPRQPGSAFPSSGGLIPLFDLGVDWNPNDHWSFGAELDFSPAASQSADAPLQVVVDGGTVQADADLRSTSSSVGGVFFVGFDSAGDSNLESAATASVNLSRFQTTQRIAAIANKALADTYAYFQTLCRKASLSKLQGCQALAGTPQAPASCK